MNHSQTFLHPRCTPATIDRCLWRRDIVTALREILPHFSGTLLDIGSGNQPYKPLLVQQVTRYIALDRASTYQQPDIEWDGWSIPLHNSSVDCAMATEVFEHCPEPEMVMREALRVLKPQGILFLSVPFLWPLHDLPYDEYRYTPFSLERHLRNAGFEHITIKAAGGWDKSMAQMMGLWARRRWSLSDQRLFARIQRGTMKYLVSTTLLPVVWFLSRQGTPFYTTFDESLMITGLLGTARKPEILPRTT